MRSSRLKGALSALLALLALGACGEDRREVVERYLSEVNGVQRRAAPDLKRANDAYVRLSQGKGRGRRQVEELRAAERSIRSTRARLTAIRPPESAARLHGAVLRAFELNAGLARETTMLGEYLPAAARALRPLERAGGRLGPSLDRPSPEAQAAAMAGYGRQIGEVGERLARLRPPPALAPTHREQLRQLARTRRLTARLETAVAGRDAQGTARLLLEFRRARGRQGASSLTRRALVEYRDRSRSVLRASGDVQRERAEIERSFEEG